MSSHIIVVYMQISKLLYVHEFTPNDSATKLLNTYTYTVHRCTYMNHVHVHYTCQYVVTHTCTYFSYIVHVHHSPNIFNFSHAKCDIGNCRYVNISVSCYVDEGISQYDMFFPQGTN